LPPEFRRDLVAEYRRRQQAALPPPPGIPPPPEAPAPPPANNWIPIGPSVLRQGQGGVQPPTSGRVTAIAVAPGGLRIYAGAANGGVWRSDDKGFTWRSLMDAFDLNPTQAAADSLAVGAVAINPANPDRVYVGSGEGSAASYFGVGPIVTSNGTSNAPSWTTEPVAAGSPTLAGSSFYALAVDPADPERVVAATLQGVYRREPDGAGGFQWARKTLPGFVGGTVTSVVVATAGGVVTYYAARSGGPVFSSADGHTWSAVGTGFPAASVGRVGLAVRTTDPSVVYALIAHSSTSLVLGVWRLDTADNTWRQVAGHPANLFGTSSPGQGWYDLAIATDPNDASRIYLGGSTVLSGGDWSGSLYRCAVTASGTGAGLTYSMVPTFIGGAIHADVHALAHAPADSNSLWAGCDGGMFHSENPTSASTTFRACNTGLQTLTMEHLGQHPTEDAVLFCGTQDNGTVRFTGEEAWLYSGGGDGGFNVVNWNDPYRILRTYVGGAVQRSSNGGQRYSYASVNVPLAMGEQCLFYAPLAGTPYDPASSTPAADADRVAFGSIRPWVSDTFGGGWQSIPANTLAGDSLNGRIRSLAFASASRFYAGTTAGGVYRFDRNAAGVWSRTALHTMGGGSTLGLAGRVTDIAVDPANADRIYITFGGTGDFRHVWYFDGAAWAARSGPAVGDPASLLDVQANAIVADPANPAHLYVGADIGVWRSLDGGATWAVYSEGLPDAAVLDLSLHHPRRLLRAATHGRSVYERTLPDAPKSGVELYVRSTQLDQGRFAAANFLPDPTAPGETVRIWRGPDIKLDTPDVLGDYQFPLTGTIDFLQFVDTLSDDFHNVATHATVNIVTRVYVQVHNRGVLPADNVRVMLLLANASAGLPALPAGFDANVRNGLPIATPDWHTVGFDTLNDLRVGFPRIAAFDLPSSMLPPPANLAGNQHHCVLAMVHHATDQFMATQTNVDLLTGNERLAAHKNLTVVEFTGTPPSPPPVVLPIRVHWGAGPGDGRFNIQVRLSGYAGRAQLIVPSGILDAGAAISRRGLRLARDTGAFTEWAQGHISWIRANQRSRRPFERSWSRQRIADVRAVLDAGTGFDIQDTNEATLAGIKLPREGHRTLFLLLNRPPRGRIGESTDLEVRQTDAEGKRTAGGLSARIALTPEPPANAPAAGRRTGR
jgi:hypothetical protein